MAHTRPDINELDSISLPIDSDQLNLASIPKDLDLTLFSILPNSDKIRLATTCRWFLHLSQTRGSPLLFKDYLLTTKNQIKVLKLQIEKGSLVEVNEILTNDPGLLIEEYCGLMPFQRAYKLRDAEMCSLMKLHFERMQDGIAKMHNQLSETFLRSLGDPQLSYAFKGLLLTLRGASEEDKNKAVAAFRQYIDDVTEKQQYPIYILIKAYSDYNSYRSLWNDAIKKRFCKEIIGYLQRKAPAWLREILLIRHKPFAAWELPRLRSFDLYGHPVEPCHPLNDKPFRGLGFNFCLDAIGECSDEMRSSRQLEWRVNDEFNNFKKVCDRRMAVLEEFRAQAPVQAEAASPGCVIS